MSLPLTYNPDIKSSYLNHALSPECNPLIVNAISKWLRPRLRKGEFDSIGVRGVSGVLIGSVVAYKLGIPLMVVRKDDNSHSWHKVEGYTQARKYIIIDDLIASGDTVKTIIEAITTFNGAKPTGIVLYNGLAWEGDVKKFGVWIKSIGTSNVFVQPKDVK